MIKSTHVRAIISCKLHTLKKHLFITCGFMFSMSDEKMNMHEKISRVKDEFSV